MLLVVSGAIVSCYKPTIGDILKCNLEAGANHFCPEGFGCEFLPSGGGVCKRNPNDGGRDDADRPGIEVGDAEVGGDADGPCLRSAARAASRTTPVCAIRSAGRAAAADQEVFGEHRRRADMQCVLSSATARGLLQNCERFNTGSSTQNDDCNPGLVCLAGVDDRVAVSEQSRAVLPVLSHGDRLQQRALRQDHHRREKGLRRTVRRPAPPLRRSAGVPGRRAAICRPPIRRVRSVIAPDRSFGMIPATDRATAFRGWCASIRPVPAISGAGRFAC